ncbi:MAG: DEAD/DEAH box helicase [Pseudomonadota bacterium]|nr:DEAD/DEAH box helicase [Pseudomonadota bacterium]
MFPDSFDPAVRTWFSGTFETPTPCQVRAWAALEKHRHTLVAAPTGSGKTLAAFLTAISELAQQIRCEKLANETRVLYVSPLKALSNDVHRNLEQPLAAIQKLLERELGQVPAITSAVRTGDTPVAARNRMRKRPPHILVTTPESLYILLTSDSGRETLKTVRTVIIDEIHALAGNKRGAHLSLSLERLSQVIGRAPVRIGLSATQRPIERVAEFFTGTAYGDATAERCEIIDEGHVRARDIAIEMPKSPLEAVVSAEVAGEIRERIIELIATHATTLIFVNTRRMTERLARALADSIGDDAVCAHHGSMSRERRHDAERRLKNGQLKALVATASLELGIDIGDVDLVCQLGSTRSLAMLLQRIGRSGHAVGGVAKGRLFPQTRDELVECMALLDMIRRDELDTLEIPRGPLDVLAQQIVAEVSCEDYAIDALHAIFTKAWPYRGLSAASLRKVVRMLAEGFSFARGRRSAYLHFDDVNGRLRGRRGARLTAITCGGAIPDNADYDVIAEPSGELVGTVNEDFAIESLPGNIFQLGNTSWRVLRVESAGLRVQDAAGEPPNMPFWFGEAPARTLEFSAAVSRLRGEFAAQIEASDGNLDSLTAGLADIPGAGPAARRQLSEYLLGAYRALGTMPTQQTLVMERFFDDSGGMQLVIHSLFGSRVNKAWGLALRKRLCRTFNFELQAAAIEDAIVISLGAVHSFPLEEVWRYLSAETVRDVLTQALLDAPMFTVRWRWVATCALAIQRFRAGRKVAPRLQRMNAEDLVALVFPDQLACAENLNGRRDIPEHPLVEQAIGDCLNEVMDIDAFERLLRAMRNGEITLVERDLTEPSPLALQVLNANPYAFLDDAPLEERRTQAVQSRRWLDPTTATDLSALDAAAIERVRVEVWPAAQSEDELHEAILMLGFVADDEIATLFSDRIAGEGDLFGGVAKPWLARLEDDGRLVRVTAPKAGWVATERCDEVGAIWANAAMTRNARSHAYQPLRAPELGEALEKLVRGRLEMTGPTTVEEAAGVFAVSIEAATQALSAIEGAGIALRGRYRSGVNAEQWCDRRLLSRIHRYTMDRLRREIEAVSSAQFVRFLCEWQHLALSTQVVGAEGVFEIIRQLTGFETPAGAWETRLLPARVRGYQSVLLDQLMASGRCTWLRLTPKRSTPSRATGTLKTTPLALMPRGDAAAWIAAVGSDEPALCGGAAEIVWRHIVERGASFFNDIVADTGLLRTQCENALDELAAAGRVTCDSFAGLRALITPASRRNPFGRRSRRTTRPGIEEAGRWDLVRRDRRIAPGRDDAWDEQALECVARSLLCRYGVVFRRLLDRESGLPPWRYLLWTYRRFETAGEIRGGRFVAGFSGEQFALPEAIAALRASRKSGVCGRIDVVNAADPLNLVGIVLPGVRIPALASNQLAYLDGEAVAVRCGTDFRLLKALDSATALKVRTALLKPNVAASRPFLRRRQR